MMIRAYIFDMDGVLVNSEPAYMEQNRRFMEACNIPYDESVIRSMVGGTLKQQVEYMQNNAPEKWSYEETQNRMFAFFRQNPVDYGKLIQPHVADIIDYLKEKKYHLAVASSSGQAHVQRILGLAGIQADIELVLSGDMFERNKPEPDIYLAAAKGLQVEPEECVVIEDSIYGITAGKAAGMKVIALKEPLFDTDQSGADYQISDLLEIEELEPLLNHH